MAQTGKTALASLAGQPTARQINQPGAGLNRIPTRLQHPSLTLVSKLGH